jgi:large subunit ribosomal protein L35
MPASTSGRQQPTLFTERKIMPKLKTNRSAAKRLRFTKSGKIKKRSANRGHILGKMSRKTKRKLRRSSYLSGADAKKMRRLLPYG